MPPNNTTQQPPDTFSYELNKIQVGTSHFVLFVFLNRIASRLNLAEVTPSVLYDHTATGALGDLRLGTGVGVNFAWYPKNF